MSLRYQISIRILLISLCLFFIGSGVGIWQARQAIKKEVDSSINLALQLIKMGIDNKKINQISNIPQLPHLKQTRHLTIHLKSATGKVTSLTGKSAFNLRNDSAPPWFINLVLSQYPKAEYQIKTVDDQLLTLIIQANPMDEIAEVWQETLVFFSVLFSLVLLTFLSVHLVFNKTLQTIHTIIAHLKSIEKGAYQKKLAYFATEEYDQIASAINHMTDELNHTQQQNQALTQHSLKIQEEERQHLSQELHDEFGQSLTAIKVMAVAAEHENADISQIMPSIIDICDHLTIVVNSMMKQLHPLILTELGLKATLEDLLYHWEKRSSSIRFSLQYDNAVDNVNRTIIIHIFRVIQESLTNIIRHAKANHVIISLKINTMPKKLELVISDDGQGCDLSQVKSGFGLLSMAERIKLLDGKFTLDTQVNKGMKIIVSIPLQ